MRKFFYFLGIVTALLIVGGGIGLYVLFRNGAALDAESKAYVDEAVIAISAHWSKGELLKRAAPQFIQTAKPKDIETLFDAAGFGLGPIVEYQGATGQSRIAATTGSGTVISANYIARARYQKGNAAIRIGLVKIDGTWMIQGFFVDSNDMISNLAGRKT